MVLCAHCEASQEIRKETDNLRDEITLRTRAVRAAIASQSSNASETPINGELGPHRVFDGWNVSLEDVKGDPALTRLHGERCRARRCDGSISRIPHASSHANRRTRLPDSSSGECAERGRKGKIGQPCEWLARASSTRRKRSTRTNCPHQRNNPRAQGHTPSHGRGDHPWPHGHDAQRARFDGCPGRGRDDELHRHERARTASSHSSFSGQRCKACIPRFRCSPT